LTALGLDELLRAMPMPMHRASSGSGETTNQDNNPRSLATL
jgi:hypothetical protein